MAERLTDDELAEVSGGKRKPKFLSYTIKHGDTLLSLAKKFNTTVAELRRMNGIGSADRIDDRKTLLVPNKEE